MGEKRPDILDIFGNIKTVQDDLRYIQELCGRGEGGRELALIQTKLDEARLWAREAGIVILARA